MSVVHFVVGSAVLRPWFDVSGRGLDVATFVFLPDVLERSLGSFLDEMIPPLGLFLPEGDGWSFFCWLSKSISTL